VVENRGQISHFTPVKIKRGVIEMLESRPSVKFSVGPNLLYTFGAGSLRGLLGDSTHFPCPFFWGGQCRSWKEERPKSNLGGDRAIIVASNVSFKF